jgi:hypothetical protein
MIGIRLADGSYYPIFDETQKNRKRMILRPANDDQHEVHVQFYRDDSEAFGNPDFLGSVDLQHLTPGKKDDKNISLIISMTDDDELEVTARDEDGGEERQLILQTQTPGGGSDNLFAGEDFSLDDDVSLPDPGDFIGDREDMEALHQEAAAHGGSLMEDEEYEWDRGDSLGISEPEREGMNPGLIAALVLVACSLTVGASFLILSLLQTGDIPPIDGFVPGILDTIRRIAALLTGSGV